MARVHKLASPLIPSATYCFCSFKQHQLIHSREFLGSAVRTLHFHCQEPRFLIPGQGTSRSHKPREWRRPPPAKKKVRIQSICIHLLRVCTPRHRPPLRTLPPSEMWLPALPPLTSTSENGSHILSEVCCGYNFLLQHPKVLLWHSCDGNLNTTPTLPPAVLRCVCCIHAYDSWLE